MPFGWRDIRHVGLGDDKVAAGDAIQDAREEKQLDAAGHRDECETDGRAELAHQQHAQAAVAVAPTAQQRPRQELRAEKDGNEEGDDGGGDVEALFCVERQDGHDHHRAGKLHENDE